MNAALTVRPVCTVRTLTFLLFLCTVFAAAPPALADDGKSDEPGHSRHGAAFDSGLRQRPWKMQGIGKTHFPITTKNPEVQEWFDQGNTLLHSFWYEEAERSFRWCLKLDPDCAMAYWGLIWCADDPGREQAFLKEAVQRKNLVSARERLYIEAWEAASAADRKDRGKTLRTRIQQIALQYPDDLEARVYYVLASRKPEDSLSNDQVLRSVLAKAPDHPGALHYQIHNWDPVSPVQAIEACRRYAVVAPGIGHATHMPGHIYSKIGMWHEAARAMDSATRVELRYMNERLALPFETWNYAHNRNYLCYIQEQLGRMDASLQGARDLIASPRDPERNKDGSYGSYDQGMTALVRALIKFERWDQILKPGVIPWRDRDGDRERRAFAQSLAYTGLGKYTEAQAQLDALKMLEKASAEKNNTPVMPPPASPSIWADTAEGLLRAAQGDLLEATRLLTEAAAEEQKERDAGKYRDDPPGDPWPLMRLLGDVYSRSGNHKLAIAAYSRSLALEPNDAFALSGLAQAHFAVGEREKAQQCYGRLLTVWSGADPNLRWRKDADALGLEAKPLSETPAPERPYHPEELVALGPSNWSPFAAPKLDGRDVSGKPVGLEQYRGKNVLLVFYLGDECAHCVAQMIAINARAADWRKQNTVVLAVSSATPQTNKNSAKMGALAIRLLSDHDHENARRFASYDDFEGIELHSTVLIDRLGRVQWKRTGGDPFTDMDFLMKTVTQMNLINGEIASK